MMCFNLVFHHIHGEKNQIADCMSNLTRRIREAEHFTLNDPILANYSNVQKTDYKSKIEMEDPWVEKLATISWWLSVIPANDIIGPMQRKG